MFALFVRKSQPGTRAPCKSPTLGLTPVSTVATTTFGLPVVMSQALGIPTSCSAHDWLQVGSFGVIAAAEPTHASATTSTAKILPPRITLAEFNGRAGQRPAFKRFGDIPPPMDRTSSERAMSLAKRVAT